MGKLGRWLSRAGDPVEISIKLLIRKKNSSDIYTYIHTHAHPHQHIKEYIYITSMSQM